MFIPYHLRTLPRSPDGAAGGGDGAPAGAPEGQPGAPAAPPAADPYWRDFLPADIKADKPEERFDRLANAWKSQRDQIAARPAPPKAATDYAFEPSDKAKPYFQGEGDPLLDIAREAALQVGLPKDAFGRFVNTIYDAAVDKGLLAAPYDAIAEGRKIAERIAPGRQWPEAKADVARLVADMGSFADTLGDQLKLGDGAKSILKSLADEASGIELLQALSGSITKQPAFGGNGQPAGTGGWTKEGLDKAVADPRYHPHSPQYDKEFRAKVDAGFRQVHGEG
ncbi:hypothetical protein V5F49_11265 [Xanthobacter sp. V3C-3]|uniref:hypothetical protein n=1 Tax=Xanthobacter lutulentifluminis TaxID=3119935 RepID=UPI003729055F